MKKGLLISVAVVVVAAVIYFLFFKNDAPTAATTVSAKQKPAPLAISQNPEVFNIAFEKMMDAYFSVQSALVDWNGEAASKSAADLQQLAQQVPYDTLKADKKIILTARNFASEIASESEALADANGIEAKRRAFNTLSDHLYSLINTVRYDREVIYHNMCPMAFNDTETAYWLSDDSTISNPYLGNKHPKYKSGMLTCGEVQDKVDYTNK